MDGPYVLFLSNMYKTSVVFKNSSAPTFSCHVKGFLLCAFITSSLVIFVSKTTDTSFLQGLMQTDFIFVFATVSCCSFQWSSPNIITPKYAALTQDGRPCKFGDWMYIIGRSLQNSKSPPMSVGHFNGLFYDFLLCNPRPSSKKKQFWHILYRAKKKQYAWAWNKHWKT